MLFRSDPAATWTYDEPKAFGKTLMVFCTVEAFGKKMTAQLPVLDYRNQAIPEPNAMQVNTAMQRCLAKAIALHGIGLYIYAGEDIPVEDTVKAPENITPLAGALDHYNAEEKELLHGLAEEITFLVKNDDVPEAVSRAKELDSQTKIAVWSLLDSKTRSTLKKAA